MGRDLTAAAVTRDAVRMARYMGLTVLRSLRRPGPVLIQPAEKALYFFVPAGSVRELHLPPGVRVHSLAESVTLPPADHTVPPGPYWLTGANGTCPFIGAAELLTAITAALTAEEGGQHLPDSRGSRRTVPERAGRGPVRSGYPYRNGVRTPWKEA